MDAARLAHEVLLPATAGSVATSELRALLARGCRSVLLGETREEYLARRMGDARVRGESAAAVAALTAAIRALAGDGAVVAVDEEPGGIRRLAHLVAPHAAATASDAGLEAAAGDVGRGLRELGVTLTLGPIVDVVRGANPWLAGRNLGPEPGEVARVGAAVVRGLRAGGVRVCVKHFPGHPRVPADPAVAPAEVVAGPDELERCDLPPFRAALAAGAEAVMLGPAVVPALDPHRPASLSPAVVELLRGGLGFRGAVVSDDLDAVSIARGACVGAVAVAALRAGADLLLVGAQHAAACAAAVEEAVAGGVLAAARLEAAAAAVRALAL